jgi:hypothetical protein
MFEQAKQFRENTHIISYIQQLDQQTIEQLKPLLLANNGSFMPEPVQDKMEAVFGVDFSDVRIHESMAAVVIGAIAFTKGNNIYFAPGIYDPWSERGQMLLGHELAHVLQQRAGRVQGNLPHTLSVNAEPALEAEADLAGEKASRGEAVEITGIEQATNTQGSDNQAPWEGVLQMISGLRRAAGTLRRRASTGSISPSQLPRPQMSRLTSGLGRAAQVSRAAGTLRRRASTGSMRPAPRRQPPRPLRRRASTGSPRSPIPRRPAPLTLQQRVPPRVAGRLRQSREQNRPTPSAVRQERAQRNRDRLQQERNRRNQARQQRRAEVARRRDIQSRASTSATPRSQPPRPPQQTRGLPPRLAARQRQSGQNREQQLLLQQQRQERARQNRETEARRRRTEANRRRFQQQYGRAPELQRIPRSQDPQDLRRRQFIRDMTSQNADRADALISRRGQNSLPRHGYHVTPTRNMSGIAQSGLDPRRGGTGGMSSISGDTNYRDMSQGRIHYGDTLGGSREYRERLRRRTGEEATLLGVRNPRMSHVDIDPDDPNRAFRTTRRIPPDQIVKLPVKKW